MIKGEVSKRELIKSVELAINSEELAAFIGAGLSIPAGFSSWENLLIKPAGDIGLDIKKEAHDLVSLAQYYSNVKNRTSVDDLIRQEFSKLVDPTKNHELLSKLPISTYWTTNYDKLIEKALERNMKVPFVKMKDEHLRGTNANFDAIVYKLHGDVDSPEDAVITRSDYEEFGYEKRRLFREVLEGDLLTKTFLFLGFSFSDPNFNYVISRLRVLLSEKKTRNHYCIMKSVSDKEEDFEYKKIKQKLKIEDLNRYGIYTCLVNDHSEVTDLLEIIVNNYRRKKIFISGSANHYDGYSNQEAQSYVHKLSYALISNGYSIVNGYGKGIGEFVLNGVADYCLAHRNIKISDVLTVIPFPQSSSSGIDLNELYKENRSQMIETCGIALFIFGNNQNEMIASGVIDEYNLAKSKGLVCLPIGYTGGAAKHIFDNINSSNTSEEFKNVIDLSNKLVENNVDLTIMNIIKSIKILNKEDH